MDVAPVETPAPGSPLRARGGLVPDELIRRVRALLDEADLQGGWEWHVEAPWVYVNPVGVTVPDQGWKLHVSATERSAAAVLSAVVPVLLAEGAAFKFAANRDCVRMLNSATAARASGGKFVTVYPLDDAHAVRVAEACHRATLGLSGPAVLSDRPYRPGSLVSYRYGGFRDQHAIDADGMVVHLLRNPDGELVPDERRGLYSAPPWVQDPFQPAPAPAGSAPPAPAPGPVLLAGRYAVRAALRHANKGGTYLAEDRETGLHVVVKEGRPHVAATSAVGDARDRVRHEAEMLAAVASVGRAPRLVDVFEQQGHVFLVEEHIPAPSLRDVVADAYDAPEAGLPAGEVARLAAALAETMAAFHAAGVVLRDFNPNNILVAAGGDDLVVIDLELAHPAGEPPAGAAGTPGYASPEQLSGRPTGRADDYWSLGATIAHVATGADPYLPADVSHTWTDPDRLEAWMARQVTDGRVDPAIAAVVIGCMAARPEERFRPADVLDALRALAARRPPRPASARASATTGPAAATRRPSPGLARVPGDVAGWLLDTMGTGTGGHLWPAGPTGIPLDPCNVQSGASGVGLFLCSAARVLDDPAVNKAVSAAAAWVSDRVARGPQRPPGLYFGLSGVAWFLTEAAGVLGRPDLLRRANELALALPVRVPNPDLSHGTAGVGLGQLHQWLRSGDDRFLARAVLAAEHLVHTARRAGPSGTVVWPVPDSAPTRLAGTTSYGFAHGTAGVATFLLYAGAATGDPAFRELALEALDGLLPLAVDVEDALYWPTGPDDDELWPHWCNGSSGVGTALVRAYAVTADARYRDAAEAAARAGLRERWRSSPVQCHGLSGDAELLLDLGRSELAAEAADAIWLQRRHDGGFAVFADDTGGGVSAAFGTGLAGVGSFFLRLATGGPRPLLLDELMEGARDARGSGGVPRDARGSGL